MTSSFARRGRPQATSLGGRTPRSFVGVVTLLFAFGIPTAPDGNSALAVPVDVASSPSLLPADVVSPVFERNLGQFDERALFAARSPGAVTFFTARGPVWTFSTSAARQADVPALGAAPRPGQPALVKVSAGVPSSVVARATFLGSNARPQVSGTAPLPGKVNYVKGSDPSDWQLGVPTFASIVYRDLYGGVDLTYDSSGQNLKGTYTVAPGIDPSVIRWKYRGINHSRVDGAGNLVLGLEAEDGRGGLMQITEAAPIAWQIINGARHYVSVAYDLDGDSVGFTLGSYDDERPLVIDPEIAYSTYLGGLAGTDEAFGIAVDQAGSSYVVGETDALDYPTKNAAQSLQGGPGLRDAFISKINPEGTALVYSTYYGGESADIALDVALDSSGNAYVAGTTVSADFPTLGAAQGSNGGGKGDGFVAKLGPTGAPVYSSFLGGTGLENHLGIAVDDEGAAYVSGSTTSSNFPTANAVQAQIAGGTDAFVTKLDPSGSSIAYSTFIGGKNHELAYGGIAVDAAGRATIVGKSNSYDFPSKNPVQKWFNDIKGDPFITQLNPAGDGYVYSTRFGSISPMSHFEEARGVALDDSGGAYVTGSTTASGFPTTPGVFQPSGGAACEPGGDPDDPPDNIHCPEAFVTKFQFIRDQEAGTEELVFAYSTFLGGGGADWGYAIDVDANGHAYIAGGTEAPDFPVRDGLQDRPSCGLDPTDPTEAVYHALNPYYCYDAFVAKLSPDASTLEFSTYLGGKFLDLANGLAVDDEGSVYVTGRTMSRDFPTRGGLQTVPTTWSPAQKLGDAFVTKITDAPGDSS